MASSLRVNDILPVCVQGLEQSRGKTPGRPEARARGNVRHVLVISRLVSAIPTSFSDSRMMGC